jgi:hypothetical protein
MKRKTLCANGLTVFRWYDPITRSTIIQTLNASGNQIGEAEYSGNKQSADAVHAFILKKNELSLVVKEGLNREI